MPAKPIENPKEAAEAIERVLAERDPIKTGHLLLGLSEIAGRKVSERDCRFFVRQHLGR